MPLTPGTVLGPYEVTAKIGEGGMGEVYRATDTSLDRQVAIKVLPDAFASDAERLARFEREAKVLASLNHPNIGAIYGLEKSGDTRALVLELVEGPTLADRIKQGPIPIDEALPIAKQIAEALEAAHEQGIIHRDLKPANIKVKDDGTVKVLDFGLAKAFQPDAGDPNLSQSPTISLTAAATQMGMVIGTAAYMAPEQASGEAIDKRCDIWSFGVVLFEMLTGRRVFEGKTVAHVMSAVLQVDPQWNTLPPTLPPSLDRLLHRCLEKNPKQRLRDIGEARVLVEEAAATPTRPVERETVGVAGWRLAAALGAAVVAGAVLGGTLPGGSDAPPMAPTTFALATTGGVANVRPAVSPDGRYVVFTDVDDDGERYLFLRDLGELEAAPVRGTRGGSDATFSPDGQALLFSRLGSTGGGGGTVDRVPLTGGPPVTVSAEHTGSYAWGLDGSVVISTGLDGLWVVPATGGAAERLTNVGDGELGHFTVSSLPGGNAVLFHVWDNGGGTVAVYSFETAAWQPLFPGTSPEYATSGHVVFQRGGALWAVAFDPDELQVRGEPVPIVEGVWVGFYGVARYDISRTGSLVYQAGFGAGQRLTWVDRAGREEPLSVVSSDFGALEISPDGTRVAVVLGDGLRDDIYVYDLARDALTQLTFDGVDNCCPLWTPDGRQVVFARAGTATISIKAADGTGAVEQLIETGTPAIPYDWADDGQTLVLERGGDLYTVPLDGDRELSPLMETPFNEQRPVLSPDGRWIAFESDAEGQDEVYVHPFPDVNAGRWKVSTDGGDEPRWSPDGEALFFRTREAVMTASVSTQGGFAPGRPEALLPDNYAGGGARRYDVAADGRFLFWSSETGASAAPQLIFVQNWDQELKRLVPVD